MGWKKNHTVKKILTFYGTWRFITKFTKVNHWSLSWARWIQSIPSHLISLKSILIFTSHLWLGLPSGFYPSGFPTKILYAFLISPMCDTCSASHRPNSIWWRLQKTKLFMQFSPASDHFPPHKSKYSSHHPVLRHSLCSSLNVRDRISQPYKTTGKCSFCIF
jgi:hypothetical protein